MIESEPSCSDLNNCNLMIAGTHQEWPGMQFKFKREFFDVTMEPMQHVLTELFNSYRHKIPGDVFESWFLNLTNFRVTNF